MGIDVIADRYVPEVRPNKRSGPKQFELYDFFLGASDESMELSDIDIPVNKNSQPITLQEFIAALTPEDISNFGQKLARAPQKVINNAMTLLPVIAQQKSDNYVSLAATIVAQSPPSKSLDSQVNRHATQVTEAAKLCPAVRKAASGNIFTRIWNTISGAQSWSDFPTVKKVIDDNKSPSWYTRLYDAVFGQKKKEEKPFVGSKMSTFSQGSRYSEMDRVGSQYSEAKTGLQVSRVSPPSVQFAGSQYSEVGPAVPATPKSTMARHFVTPESLSPASPPSFIERTETPLRQAETPELSRVQKGLGSVASASPSPLEIGRPSPTSPMQSPTQSPRAKRKLEAAFDAVSPSTTSVLSSPLSQHLQEPRSVQAAPSLLLSENMMTLTPKPKAGSQGQSGSVFSPLGNTGSTFSPVSTASSR